MSHCGYFQIQKGTPVCTHPTEGDLNNQWSNVLSHQCERCRRECGGIWPSQLPSADQSGWQYDVVKEQKTGPFRKSKLTVLKSWTHGECVTIKGRP